MGMAGAGGGVAVVEDVMLHPDALAGVSVGAVLEIWHEEAVWSRLLVQVSARSLRCDARPDTISVFTPLVDAFRLREYVYQRVHVAVVAAETARLQLVELTFRGQLLTQADMWRLRKTLMGRVLHRAKIVDLSCNVLDMWRCSGERVVCGCVTADTKLVFRSLSSEMHVFVQMSPEMWQYDSCGDLYVEKTVNGFLVDLFDSWRRHNVSHSLTLTLFWRVVHDNPLDRRSQCSCPSVQSKWDEVSLDAARPYEDFYHVVVQNGTPVGDDSDSILASIRSAVYNFRYAVLDKLSQPDSEESAEGRLAHLSSAENGNLLEAINLSLNVNERSGQCSLQRTGQSCVVLTAGVGVFGVCRRLNQLTEQRVLDSGVGVDLVCVAEQPLHAVPLMRFHCQRPSNGYGTDMSAADYHLPHTWINLSFYSCRQRVGYSDFVPRIRVPAAGTDDGRCTGSNSADRSRCVDLSVIDSVPLPISPYDCDNYDTDIFTPVITASLDSRSARSRTTTSIRPAVCKLVSAASERPALGAISSCDESGSSSSSSAGAVEATTPGTSDSGTNSSHFQAASPRTASSSLGDIGVSPTTYNRTVFNPFDPHNFVVKHTTNRRRWSHIFPRDSSGAPLQHHHVSGNVNSHHSLTLMWDGGGSCSATVRTGVDWRSLTVPACLPVTTDHHPDVASLHRHHYVTQYTLMVEESTHSSACQTQPTADMMFEELICQRLCQGFQLVESSSGSEEGFSRYLFSQGNVYHSLELNGSTIFVSQYKPQRYPSQLSFNYTYLSMGLLGCSNRLNRAVFTAIDRRRYNWNYLDNYVCIRDAIDFPLTLSLNYWQCCLLLVPITGSSTHSGDSLLTDRVHEFIRFVGGTVYASRLGRGGSALLLSSNRQRVGSGGTTTSTQSQDSSSTAPQLPMDAPESDITAALRCTERGLLFLSRDSAVTAGLASLPAWTFVAAELVLWCQQHVMGVTSEAAAVAFAEQLSQRRIIEHASLSGICQFINGVHLYRLTITENEVEKGCMSGTVAAERFRLFGRHWLQVETKFSWSSVEHQQEVADFPVDSPHCDCHTQSEEALLEDSTWSQCLVSLDPARLSGRPQWGHLQYERCYNPRRCYQLQLRWLVGSGEVVSQLLLAWQHRADSCGFRLLQIPPLAPSLGSGVFDHTSSTGHPFHVPVVIPLNVAALSGLAGASVEGRVNTLPTLSRADLLRHLQHSILRRLDMLPLSGVLCYRHVSSDGDSLPYYVHSSGQCLVQIGVSRWSDSAGNSPRAEDGERLEEAQFIWHVNHLWSRQWPRLAPGPAASCIDTASSILTQLQTMCRDDDGQLTALWTDIQKQMQNTTPPETETSDAEENSN